MRIFYRFWLFLLIVGLGNNAEPSQGPSESSVASPQLKITSFLVAAKGTDLSEICGNVSGVVPQGSFAKIKVDYKTKNPGIYNLVLGAEKTFCGIVLSYTGLATAELISPDLVSIASVDAERN